MPITYEIDAARGVVFTTFQGVVTKEDALALFERLRRDSAFQPGFKQLVDTRGTTRHDLTADDMHIVASCSAFDANACRAIVAEQDIIFGMYRMYETIRDSKSGQVRVYRDMENALHWLELD